MHDFINCCVACGEELPLEWNSWLCTKCQEKSAEIEKENGNGKENRT